MTDLTVILPPVLVLALVAHTLVRAVLYRPWTVKPVYRFLFVRSAWYRRWIMRRHVAAFRQMNRALATFPAVAKRYAAALRTMGEVLARAA
jgi:hypothetical protein